MLKLHGCLILATPFMWPEHEEPHDFFRYTRYGLKYLAEKCEFTVIEISADSGFWVQFTIRLGYYLDRARLSFMALPLQILSVFLDMMDARYKRRDPTGFLTLLRKDS